MVNYCCVYGCGRNSKSNENLSFYSLPNERHRQIAWLKAAGREDLLDKKFSRHKNSRRFCSRHFTPSNVKNKSRHLGPDVVPTLFLPGSWEGEKSDDEHMDIACNSCNKPVVGFRYKCVTCEDFDLCQKCEYMEAHREHFMLRVPKPIKFKLVDNLIKKWRKLFNAEHITADTLDGGNEEQMVSEDSSDDDQPITKYAKNYDSGVDLSEDVKEKIRKEIQRVTSLKLDQQKKPKKATNKTPKKKEDRKRQTKEDNTERDRIITPSKRMKVEEGVSNSNTSFAVKNAPEVVFADVNDIKYHQLLDLKPERDDYPNVTPISSSVNAGKSTPTLTQSLPSTSGIQTTSTLPIEVPGPTYPTVTSIAGVPGPDMQQPVMHVKLSDDLTELMIEVTSNNQRTIYKYPENSNG